VEYAEQNDRVIKDLIDDHERETVERCLPEAFVYDPEPLRMLDDQLSTRLNLIQKPFFQADALLALPAHGLGDIRISIFSIDDLTAHPRAALRALFLISAAE
jgi:hypothetical protein